MATAGGGGAVDVEAVGAGAAVGFATRGPVGRSQAQRLVKGRLGCSGFFFAAAVAAATAAVVAASCFEAPAVVPLIVPEV